VTVHSLEHSIADVLYGKVDIFKYSVVCAYLLDKLVGDLVGIAIKKTYPRYLCRIGYCAQKLCKAIFAVNIESVAGYILCYDIKLLYTESLEVLRLFYDILYSTASEPSAYCRNSAVCTAVITALCYLKISGIFGGCEYSVAAEPYGLLILKRGIFPL
jgi:hypothetical protein